MDERTQKLDRLYREEGPTVWAYLHCRVADRHTAEELFQETFVAVARGFERLATAASPRAWLLGIAANLLREHRRRTTQRRSVPLDEEPAEPATPADDPRLEAVREAISRLPDAQREVLETRVLEGLSYAEIAEALAIPLGTVRSRLHHAVAELRRRMVEASAAAKR